MTVNVQFTPESRQKFRRTIAEFQDVFKKDLPDALVYCTWQFARSARAHTRPCKAPLGLRDVKDGGPHPLGRYMIVRWMQHGNPPEYIRTNDLADPRRVIRFNGAARNSWNGVMRGIGKASKGGVCAETGTAQKNLTDAVPNVVVTNVLSYMPAIHPAIMQDSLDRVVRHMEARLVKSYKKALLRV